jgi:hypothetical protein
MRHRCCGYNHGKAIIGHHQVLPLCTGATVYGALNVPRMPFGIPWRRVNCHPAFPVAKPAVDHAPCLGARSRLSDCPALFFRMLQSVSNISVWMAGHDLALLLVVFRLQQLYHHGTAERRRARQPLRACLPVAGQRALRSATKGSITKAWRRTAHSTRFWAVRGFFPCGPPLKLGVDMTSDVKSEPPIILHFFHLS